jgi:hypothetical protein
MTANDSLPVKLGNNNIKKYIVTLSNTKFISCILFILILSFAAMGQQPKPLLSLAHNNLNVFIGGKIRTTLLMSNKRTYPSGTAFLLLPKDATGEERSFDFNARSSNFYIALDGPKVGNFKLGGMMFFMLTANVTSESYGILPSLLYVDLKNQHWRFAFGQQMDVFAERIPNMIDSYFALAASGCAGNSSRGQIRVEKYFSVGKKGKFTLTAAASEPITSYFSRDLRNNTADNGVPNFEWSAKYRTGKDTAAWVPYDKLELAVSGVIGSYRVFKNDINGKNIRVNHPQVFGIAGEYAIRFSKRVGIQGEVYTGKALGNYAAAIFQTTKGDFDKEIRSFGFWSELTVYWKKNLQTNVGYGQDKCNKSDLLGSGITQNSTLFGNLIWDINPSFQIGIEASYKQTNYLAPLKNNQGYTAMFMTQYKF